ncbi:N-acetyltransferase family protein [Salipaludibacillus sp. HK11]|uniref:GNAT family N-acetyltransferase n=1 Tax=Salipaludibacillus sp. HK11 TaxID=3394320 RepID=UPI0039FD5141
MIRLAAHTDLPEIKNLLEKAVKVMNEAGNYQWDENYPLLSDFEKDIEEEELYSFIINEEVAGVACLSEKEHEEYPEIAWTYEDRAITVKRTAVNPAYQGQGIASKLYKHAEKVATEKGLKYIKTDTFEKNKRAQRVFILNDFQYVAERLIFEKQDKIVYFEKRLGLC